MDPDALRAMRWFARVLTLAAAWPLSYAFFGKHEFDPNAMMFGGPGVLIGLALWIGSGYRLRHPNGGPAPAPASTIAGRLTEQLDAGLAKLPGTPAFVALSVASIACGLGLASAILETTWSRGETAIMYAVMAGVLAFGWRAIDRRSIAIATALLMGVALLAKPWVWPVSHEFMGQHTVFSPTSETHLYFVLPGLALIGLAVILVLGTKLPEPVQVTTTKQEPTRLEPPQPKFPRPPARP